jgi:hypothetical protein
MRTRTRTTRKAPAVVAPARIVGPLDPFRILTPREALEALGTTREQVALALHPFTDGTAYANPRDCALCRYLRRCGFENVIVGGQTTMIGEVRIALPEAVRRGAYLAFFPGAA